MQKLAIVWFRRDLRLDDNAALYHALKKHKAVLPLFIFDTNILNQLEDKYDCRVDFIHQQISELNNELAEQGSGIKVYHDTPENTFTKLTQEFDIEAVYTNHDYEPYAKERDERISKLLNDKGIVFNTYKDQVIFEKDEVLKKDGTPYTVYTPYMKIWREQLNDFFLSSYPTEKYMGNLYPMNSSPILSLELLGFKKTDVNIPSKKAAIDVIENYDKTRDIPSIKGTSRLSVHLRFGTISIRKLARFALQHNQKYVNELIWREFYMMILWHFPHVVKSSFKPGYDAVKWRDDEEQFKRWCEGKTGYPIVDAGMRELNSTGWMHNRVRMIVASFLVKDLLIDWRWGEAYFAQKLLDFELSSNNGGWQWAAGTGCDAAPYFRVFNPYLQTKKFDPDLKYIKKWVPEFEELTYPQPIVDHAFARDRALKAYKIGLNKDETKY